MTTAAAPAPAPRLRGHASGRLGRRTLIVFGGVFLVVAAIAAGIIALVAPAGLVPACKPYAPCGAPPKRVAPLVNTSTWGSTTLGFKLNYDSSTWTVSDESPDGVTLSYGDGTALLQVQGVMTADAGGALSAKLSSLKGNLLGLSTDADPKDTLLGPNVGLRPGDGGAFTANLQTPQGVTPVWVDAMSSTDGHVAIVATLLSQHHPGSDEQSSVTGDADNVLKSVTWGGGL
jgi:hypothetical protein